LTDGKYNFALMNTAAKIGVKTIKIIYIDDDEDDRVLFREALSKINIPTVLRSFSDCDRMVSHLEGRTSDMHPDIIFLDINMPKKNGLTCLREMRERNKKFSQIPIVMLTTSSRAIDIEESHKLGANLYINKPENINDLTGVLIKVLTPAAIKNLNMERGLASNF
jgi:CheY-like chemotaxis protein